MGMQGTSQFKFKEIDRPTTEQTDFGTAMITLFLLHFLSEKTSSMLANAFSSHGTGTEMKSVTEKTHGGQGIPNQAPS